jgi:Undecaprenyl-phosphate glucose phosphotransferase
MLSEPLISEWPVVMPGAHRAPSSHVVPLSVYPRPRTQELVLYFLVSDMAMGIVSALAIFHVYSRPLGYDLGQLWFGLASFAVGWPFSAYMQQLYGQRELLGSFRRLMLRTVATCALAFGIVLLCGFGLNVIGSVSRVWLLGWAAFVLGWTCVTRFGWRAYWQRRLQNGGCHERALVLAGSEQTARRLAERVEHESKGHIRVAGAAALPGTFDVATFKWLEDIVGHGIIDRIIIGHFAGATAQTNALLARLMRLSIDVTVLPELEWLQAPVLRGDRIGTLPAIEFDFRPLTLTQTCVKRAEDLLLAGGLTVFLLPVLLLIGLAIKLDSPGPVMFRQMRAGFNGRRFRVWKFRTMHAHARDEHAVRQTSRGDSRVTRVGRFLRRTSLDELPQLFNVLVGDMSIVGPRPHALGMTAVGRPLHEVIEEYSARHRLKPGITGWAQINGCRGEVNSREKLRDRVLLDCYYIENWSLSFDLWIILRTAAAVLGDPNAY